MTDTDISITTNADPDMVLADTDMIKTDTDISVSVLAKNIGQPIYRSISNSYNVNWTDKLIYATSIK